MNPRIERDPYLRLVAERWGESAVAEAGWFDDGDPGDAPLDDVGWLCTPLDVVSRAVRRPHDPAPNGSTRSARTAPVVLLSTGGFFPVHAGHVAMMEAARRQLEAAGNRVVGGYLSPAHDDYIRLKCGSVDEPVSCRLARADAALAGTGWLSVDPWEALARRVAVNYTDVTARLETYLRHHVHPAIEVVYVCGADNARFALAFTERGGCVVVGRPGYEPVVERWRADSRVAGNPRIHWIDGQDASSSSSVRTAGTRDPGPPRTRLALRMEDARAVATLGLAPGTLRSFQDALLAELAGRVTIDVTRLEDQADRVATAGTISLDPLLPAEIDLGISRLFDLGGHRSLGHVARPGTPPLAEQLAAIPPGRWSLRDDDRATGATVRYVAEHVPAGVALTTPTFALDPRRSADGEIADSRDFLLGTDHGGLVVALPGGETGRAPYLLPYVDPAVRTGLPGGDAIAFSLATWDLNTQVFAPTALTVADLPPPAARTLAAAGFAATTTLADACRHHANILRSLIR